MGRSAADNLSQRPLKNSPPFPPSYPPCILQEDSSPSLPPSSPLFSPGQSLLLPAPWPPSPPPSCAAWWAWLPPWRWGGDRVEAGEGKKRGRGGVKGRRGAGREERAQGTSTWTLRHGLGGSSAVLQERPSSRTALHCTALHRWRLTQCVSLPARLLACLPACLPTYLPACLRACVCACVEE